MLGLLEVERVPITAPRQRGVLALLAIRAGTSVGSDWLIDQLWAGEPPQNARTTLQSCVYRLRAALERTSLRIHSTPDGYSLEVPQDASDLQEYGRLVAQGRKARAEGRTQVAADRLREALAQWSGEFLAGVDLPAIRERGRELEQDRLDVLETCLECELELGQHGEIVPELQALTAQHPLRERPWQLLMAAQYAAGLRAEALATYQLMRGVLDEQLGVEPSAAVQELQARILNADPLPISRHRTTVPRQLPPGVPLFTGREAELKRLDESLARSRLCAVVGPAGVGKTSTAVHWARRVAERFPDGQLYADLRGFDPSGQQADPGTTLAGFITALGTPPERIPPELDNRTALFRSLLDDRRVLVVLDNVRSSEQVLPLLAGGPDCVTVVTSRDQLAGLVATAQASPVLLEPLDHDQARRLLKARVGAERAAETEAVESILAGCAGLPLALALVCAQAELHPDWPLASIADELRSAVRDIGAVLSWSYRLLSGPTARLFRLLAVHPGPGFGADACAALARASVEAVQPLLDELCATHQLTETAPGRYAIHDLLRDFAAGLAQETDPDEALQARDRLLDLMVHTAHAATCVMLPALAPLALDPADPMVELNPPASAETAKQWLVTEQDVLIGLTHFTGADLAVWRLSWTLAGFLDRQGAWQEWLGVAERGLAAADRAGSPPDRVTAYRWLARALTRNGRHDEALAAEVHSVRLAGEVGDPNSEAHAYISLGNTQSKLGDNDAAIASTEESRRLFAELGDRSGQANALSNLGWYQTLLGNHGETVRYCREALHILRDLGEVTGEADTLHSLGVAYAGLAQHTDALESFGLALEIEERLGRQYKIAVVLYDTGIVYDALGDDAAALRCWRRSLDLFGDLDDPRAEHLRSKMVDVQ
jgi:DNA-binding SARP family transcriptional activator